MKVIRFMSSVPIDETMVFEEPYEGGLRLARDEKAALLEKAVAVWMYVDGVLAGECYGVSPKDLGEEIEDVTAVDLDSIYCYSTTILPPFQGHGLGKLLKANWLGRVAKRFTLVTGHSTAASMKAVNEFFGATHTVKHENWYESGRVAWFYRLPLF